jgi:hypothetical protein
VTKKTAAAIRDLLPEKTGISAKQLQVQGILAVGTMAPLRLLDAIPALATHIPFGAWRLCNIDLLFRASRPLLQINLAILARRQFLQTLVVCGVVWR